MKLKLKITSTELDALSDSVKALYAEQDDGSYALEVEGVEDTGALKRAKDYEKQLRQTAEKAARELKDQLADINLQMEELKEASAGKGGKKSSELEALEKSWKEKLANKEKELTDKLAGVQNALKTQMVDSVAMRMATDLAGENAELLLPHISRRLAADIADGKASTKVLDADGQPSALTPEELQKEFLSNTKYSSIVIASKASGGGAGGERKGGGGATKKLSDMSATEEAKFANEHPEDYKRMVETYDPQA